MAFSDHELFAGLAGKTVSGLTLSKTAAMTLELATGSVILHRTGVTHTLAAAQSHVFTSDPTKPTRVFMGLVDNGTTKDLWVDSYVDDGSKIQANPPTGYSLILPVAWFTIAAGETDLANAAINRRVWI